MKTKKENQLRAWPICPTARRFMRKLLTITFTISGCLAFCPRPALVFSAPSRKYVYTDASGKKQSAQVVDKYYPKKIVQPFAKSDTNIDPTLRRAATIAGEPP